MKPEHGPDGRNASGSGGLSSRLEEETMQEVRPPDPDPGALAWYENLPARVGPAFPFLAAFAVACGATLVATQTVRIWFPAPGVEGGLERLAPLLFLGGLEAGRSSKTRDAARPADRDADAQALATLAGLMFIAAAIPGAIYIAIEGLRGSRRVVKIVVFLVSVVASVWAYPRFRPRLPSLADKLQYFSVAAGSPVGLVEVFGE